MFDRCAFPSCFWGGHGKSSCLRFCSAGSLRAARAEIVDALLRNNPVLPDFCNPICNPTVENGLIQDYA